MPGFTEPRRAIGNAEFPERGVPRSRIARNSIRVGRDQPTLHDLLNEAVSKQAFAVDAGKFNRLENPSSTLLEVFELRQRRCEFFVGFSHAGLLQVLAGSIGSGLTSQ